MVEENNQDTRGTHAVSKLKRTLSVLAALNLKSRQYFRASSPQPKTKRSGKPLRDRANSTQQQGDVGEEQDVDEGGAIGETVLEQGEVSEEGDKEELIREEKEDKINEYHENHEDGASRDAVQGTENLQEVIRKCASGRSPPITPTQKAAMLSILENFGLGHCVDILIWAGVRQSSELTLLDADELGALGFEQDDVIDLMKYSARIRKQQMFEKRHKTTRLTLNLLDIERKTKEPSIFSPSHSRSPTADGVQLAAKIALMELSSTEHKETNKNKNQANANRLRRSFLQEHDVTLILDEHRSGTFAAKSYRRSLMLHEGTHPHHKHHARHSIAELVETKPSLHLAETIQLNSAKSSAPSQPSARRMRSWTQRRTSRNDNLAQSPEKQQFRTLKRTKGRRLFNMATH